VNAADIPNSSFDTRSPLTFAGEDRGKRVYFAGRREISREGKKGDLSEIVSELIP
jgi:hypothetical protein